MTATSINPALIVAQALKAIKASSDYSRLIDTTDPDVLSAAWERLSELEQTKITHIVNNATPTDPQAIALELSSCGTKSELENIKSEHGETLIRQAWKLLPENERTRLTNICRPKLEEETPLVPETPAPAKKKTLVDLSSDLQRLDDLLDNIENEQGITPEVQVAIDELLQERDSTQAEVLAKLDNYCDLINSRVMWAQARKADADRLAKLAEADFKTIDFLKARLKLHLESTDQKKVRTKRYNIAIIGNGGKAPLKLDNTAVTDLPERFQRVQVEPDKEAIRSALEAGEELKFAYIAQRENHLRIK